MFSFAVALFACQVSSPLGDGVRFAFIARRNLLQAYIYEEIFKVHIKTIDAVHALQSEFSEDVKYAAL